MLIPISFLLAVMIPAAEMHVVDKDEFAAGFRIRRMVADLPRQPQRIYRGICDLLCRIHDIGHCAADHVATLILCLSPADSYCQQ